jgi:hypothetical protein
VGAERLLGGRERGFSVALLAQDEEVAGIGDELC